MLGLKMNSDKTKIFTCDLVEDPDGIILDENTIEHVNRSSASDAS